MTYKAYTESYIQDIADAIRSKNGKTSKMTVSQMADEIRMLVADGYLYPLTIAKNGVYNIEDYQEDGVAVGFNPITVEMNDADLIYLGNHVDENGKWIRPEDWDDIETQEIPEDRDEMWLLYDVKSRSKPFCAWNVRTSSNATMTYEVGRITDGEFSVIGSGTISAESGRNRPFQIPLSQYAAENDRVVVRCSLPAGIYFQVFALTSWTADSYIDTAVSSIDQTLLMRYGSLRKPTGVAHTARCRLIESDRLIGYGKLTTASTSVSLSNAFYDSANLQRVVLEDWDVAGKIISNLSGFIRSCPVLSDVNIGGENIIDMTGWITARCTGTSMNYFLYSNKSLHAKVIVKDWDMSKVQLMQYAFGYNDILEEIEGIETWRNMTAVTNMGGAFQFNKRLTGTIDLSASGLGSTGKLTNVSYIISDSPFIEHLILDNVDLSNCTTVSNLASGCTRLKSISFGGSFVPPSSKCTTFTRLFMNDAALEEVVLDGWDFSAVSYSAIERICYGCRALKRCEIKDCVSPNVVNSSTSDGTLALFGECPNLEYLDVSSLNASVMTNTSGFSTSYNSLYSLIDFYPPTNITNYRAFAIGNSPRLSDESLQRIIDNLTIGQTSSNTTLTLGAYNISRLSDEQKSTIAQKGFTLA